MRYVVCVIILRFMKMNKESSSIFTKCNTLYVYKLG